MSMTVNQNCWGGGELLVTDSVRDTINKTLGSEVIRRGDIGRPIFIGAKGDGGFGIDTFRGNEGHNLERILISGDGTVQFMTVVNDETINSTNRQVDPEKVKRVVVALFGKEELGPNAKFNLFDKASVAILRHKMGLTQECK